MKARFLFVLDNFNQKVIVKYQLIILIYLAYHIKYLNLNLLKLSITNFLSNEFIGHVV